MILRGYAIVYNQPAAVCGDDGASFELVFEGAFDRMLARRDRVALQFLTHDPSPAIANTADGTLQLFSDAYGLGFEADIGTKLTHEQVRLIVTGEADRASVNFVRTASDVGLANSTRYISDAEIDHIAITGDPAYRNTRVWRADCDLEFAPARILEAAVEWDFGRAESRIRDRVSAPVPPSREVVAAAQHPHPAVAALISARMDGWVAQCRAIMSTGRSGLYAHACISDRVLQEMMRRHRK